MEELSHAGAGVATLFEEFGKSYSVRHGAAEVMLKVVDSGGVGAQACQQRGARRATDGLLAVGFGEDGAACGERVDVWSVDMFGTIAAHFRTEVVYRDQENIHFPCGIGR